MKRFDGKWYGRSDGELRGTIKGNVMTWPTGEDTNVSYDGGLDVSLSFDGTLCKGMLIDGGISWDDGDDIWIKGIDSIETIITLYPKINIRMKCVAISHVTHILTYCNHFWQK